ncbi:MAG: (Fe-S)-binding protein [Gammaproteobacteria bacterium]|nr:(Fe-S)-binding protein [Gammaproteobacteria bacterium]
MSSPTSNPSESHGHAVRVGLFVTCLVDLMRPSVGFAAVKLLEQAGCIVEVPELQTCCGQPAYNSGDFADTEQIARQVIAAFEHCDYLVAPSGSCVGMIREHYPRLFATDVGLRNRAEALAARSFELTSFLHDVLGIESLNASHRGSVTYHDSCSGLRELDVHAQPRALLGHVGGLELREMADSNVCCGFGGTFCVKYPKISEHLVSNKVGCIVDTGADALLGGDLGCLLNIAGRLKREGRATRVYHVAEVLAGMTHLPAIGEPDAADDSP